MAENSDELPSMSEISQMIADVHVGLNLPLTDNVFVYSGIVRVVGDSTEVVPYSQDRTIILVDELYRGHMLPKRAGLTDPNATSEALRISDELYNPGHPLYTSPYGQKMPYKSPLIESRNLPKGHRSHMTPEEFEREFGKDNLDPDSIW